MKNTLQPFRNGTHVSPHSYHILVNVLIVKTRILFILTNDPPVAKVLMHLITFHCF